MESGNIWIQKIARLDAVHESNLMVRGPCFSTQEIPNSTGSCSLNLPALLLLL